MGASPGSDGPRTLGWTAPLRSRRISRTGARVRRAGALQLFRLHGRARHVPRHALHRVSEDCLENALESVTPIRPEVPPSTAKVNCQLESVLYKDQGRRPIRHALLRHNPDARRTTSLDTSRTATRQRRRTHEDGRTHEKREHRATPKGSFGGKLHKMDRGVKMDSSAERGKRKADPGDTAVHRQMRSDERGVKNEKRRVRSWE